MSAIWGSIKRTITEPGKPFALGPSSERWHKMTITARKDENQSNGSNIYIYAHSPDSAGIRLTPGETYEIRAPMESYFTSAQWFLDGQEREGGIVAFFTRAGWQTWNDIEFKVETALRKVIQTISTTMPDVKVTEGWTDEERQPNTIICSVTEASEAILETGIWACRCEIMVRSEWGKADQWAKHRLRTAYARDVIMSTFLAEHMSAMVDNLTLINNSVSDREVTTESDPDTRHWISTLAFTIRACGSVIPEESDDSYLGPAVAAGAGGQVIDRAGNLVQEV
jgi:hypothetical protein